MPGSRYCGQRGEAWTFPSDPPLASVGRAPQPRHPPARDGSALSGEAAALGTFGARLARTVARTGDFRAFSLQNSTHAPRLQNRGLQVQVLSPLYRKALLRQGFPLSRAAQSAHFRPEAQDLRSGMRPASFVLMVLLVGLAAGCGGAGRTYSASATGDCLNGTGARLIAKAPMPSRRTPAMAASSSRSTGNGATSRSSRATTRRPTRWTPIGRLQAETTRRRSTAKGTPS